MPPRKKRSTEAIAVAPTRRSTRTRRPSQAAVAAAAAASEGFNQNNSQAQKTTTRDSKVPKKEASVTGGPQEDVVVHRPRETAAEESTAAALPPPPPLTVATTTVKTTHISSGGDDETKSGGSEKAAITIAEEKGDSHDDKNIIGAVDYDMSDDDSDDYDDDGNDDATDDDGDDDDESEDKIVAAHPSLPKAATRTLPVKIINKKSQSRRYVAVPAADDDEDELATEQPAIKIVKVSDTSGGRKTRSKYDRPEEMLTNPRSPLVGARLRVSEVLFFFPLVFFLLLFLSSSLSFLLIFKLPLPLPPFVVVPLFTYFIFTTLLLTNVFSPSHPGPPLQRQSLGPAQPRGEEAGPGQVPRPAGDTPRQQRERGGQTQRGRPQEQQQLPPRHHPLPG